ncbi:ABC transporter ATP-binding protein [Cytobacillus oceanisediminis]|uniref:ABC transporter ATP-binding protein n=1 Tax=Niallia sp. FSL W8-1348 TaxID=2954656 RepID=UPI001CCFDC1C|nr:MULTISPECIES: ABC transporter ATP-binding protein [Bacillaceae]MBZ9532829.1 ABC transporter ATP-binding protein [Cytobacillus oceanisediminis]MCF2648096.1 ABC transporter ATP-binding protein [Niallia circulans]MDU1847717.1 ABC transporter ATP-binding protein [Niallia nealsonii]
MQTIVELRNVTKEFQQKKAVKDVSFSIKQGEMVAILGANGAGKTTTMRMLLGLMKPTRGTVSLFQKNPRQKEVLEKIGGMLQEVSVMDSLKVRELIQLIQSYYQNPIELTTLLELTGLQEEDWNQRTEKLSGGQKRRLNFALALAGNPDLLFLDEPTVGMDVTSREQFWKKMKELNRQGKTILFTTHYLQEADEVAGRIIMINKGEVVGDGTPAHLKEKLTKPRVMFQERTPYTLDFYQNFPFVEDVQKEKDKVTIVAKNSDQLLKEIFDRQLNIYHIEVKLGRLEEVFSQLLGEKKEVGNEIFLDAK